MRFFDKKTKEDSVNVTLVETYFIPESMTELECLIRIYQEQEECANFDLVVLDGNYVLRTLRPE